MKSSIEQFKEWWEAYADKCAHPVEDVEYYAAKDAWQASRASIVIELLWLGKSSLMDTDDVVEAIELQGLTAKAKP